MVIGWTEKKGLLTAKGSTTVPYPRDGAREGIGSICGHRSLDHLKGLAEGGNPGKMRIESVSMITEEISSNTGVIISDSILEEVQTGADWKT